MPGGFFRGLVATAKDTYNQVKTEIEARPPANAAPYGQHTSNNYQSCDHNNPQYGHGGQNSYFGQQQHGQYNPQYGGQHGNYTGNQYGNQYNNVPVNQSHPYGFNPPVSPPPQQQHQQHHDFSNQYAAQHFPDRPHPPMSPPNSYHQPQSPEQRVPQSPPYTPAPAPAPAPAQTPTPTQNQADNSSSPVYFVPDTPGGCNPTTNLSQSYYTASVPSFAVCTQCFHNHVSNTPYAPLFKLEQHDPSSTNETSCDISIATVGTAWKTACTRAAATSSPQEQQVWLNQFAQHFQEVQAQILRIGPQVASLLQEIQVGALTAQYQQASAMIQWKGGMSSMIHGYGGSISTQMAHQRMGEVGRMKMDIDVKKMQLRGLLNQLQNLYGPQLRFNVNL